MSLARRLAAALAQPPVGVPLPGDDAADLPRPAPPIPAAVLIAAVERPAPGLLLTRRHEALRAHAGQIAFPGGRIDPGDATPTAAALREAEEEIGLPVSHVTPVAELSRFETITGYMVTPVLAVVPPDLPLVRNPDEVAEWFEVPLADALDPARRTARLIDFGGRPRTVYEIEAGGRTIWGATAAMLVNLSARLGPAW